MVTRQAVIAFGSNLGERAEAIELARVALDAHPQIVVMAMSGLHESVAIKPHGADDTAPAYLNAVALIDTDLSAEELLAELMRIERENGRERAERWGDRTLDLDIVAIAGEQIATEELTVPHPRAQERDFVLAPWLEVDPEAKLGEARVADLLARINQPGVAR